MNRFLFVMAAGMLLTACDSSDSDGGDQGDNLIRFVSITATDDINDVYREYDVTIRNEGDVRLERLSGDIVAFAANGDVLDTELLLFLDGLSVGQSDTRPILIDNDDNIPASCFEWDYEADFVGDVTVMERGTTCD